MEIYHALARPRCVPISELGMQQILSPAAPECNRLPPLSQVVPDFGVLAGAHVRPLLENLRECTLGGNPRRHNICHFSSLPSYHQLLHTPVLRFKLSKMEGEKTGEPVTFQPGDFIRRYEQEQLDDIATEMAGQQAEADAAAGKEINASRKTTKDSASAEQATHPTSSNQKPQPRGSVARELNGRDTTPAPSHTKQEINKNREALLKTGNPLVTVVLPGVSLGLFRQAQRAHQAKPGSNTTPAPTLHKREKNKSREAPLKKATPGGYMLVRGGWRGEGGIGSLLRACWVTVVVAGISLGLFRQAMRQRQAKRLGYDSTKEMRDHKRKKSNEN